MATELNNGRVLCEQCGDDFKRIGGHWTGDCCYPEISQHKKEIVIGLLMGDGCVGKKDTSNQRIVVGMTSPNYLEYVDNQLGWLSTGVNFEKSSEDIAERDKKSGFNPVAAVNNYSDMYRLRTRSHPFITSLTDWYSSGSKVWPENIDLTPTVLKHWYCGDGSYNNNASNNNIQITMDNEVENTEKVSSYFKNVGLPEPSNYAISEEKDGSNKCQACWTKEGSRKLWDYMGEPLPDFAYKWPEDLR